MILRRAAKGGGSICPLFLAAAALLGFASCCGCGGRVRATKTAEQRAAPRAIPLRDGLAQCVPEPLEECANARDDNCNGLIDEGCDQRMGEVQFVIAWDAPNADVDLMVTDPKGELVEVGHPSAAGLVKERDCPGRKRECRGRNVENVYLDGSEPKQGRYRVKVRLERLNDEDTPIRVTFGARVGRRTYSAEIELERPEDERQADFGL